MADSGQRHRDAEMLGRRAWPHSRKLAAIEAMRLEGEPLSEKQRATYKRADDRYYEGPRSGRVWNWKNRGGRHEREGRLYVGIGSTKRWHLNAGRSDKSFLYTNALSNCNVVLLDIAYPDGSRDAVLSHRLPFVQNEQMEELTAAVREATARVHPDLVAKAVTTAYVMQEINTKFGDDGATFVFPKGARELLSGVTDLLESVDVRLYGHDANVDKLNKNSGDVVAEFPAAKDSEPKIEAWGKRLPTKIGFDIEQPVSLLGVTQLHNKSVDVTTPGSYLI